MENHRRSYAHRRILLFLGVPLGNLHKNQRSITFCYNNGPVWALDFSGNCTYNKFIRITMVHRKREEKE